MAGANINEIHSCAGCLNDIGDEDYIAALSQDWHKDCFRCSVCDVQLNTWYFEKGGLLFCQNDYWARYGDSCQQCSEVITGPVMAAGEHRFHPECFACVQCGIYLEDTEPYALIDRSRLYCGTCYSELAQTQREAHAIRVVQVPADAVRLAAQRCGAFAVAHSRCAGKLSWLARALLRAALRVCLHLACYRIDSSCGILTLHIGDRVLEVNGTPVRNRSLSEIERALSRPEVIQLTIEHNPDTINVKRGQSCTEDLKESPRTDKIPSKEEIIPETHSNEKTDENSIRKERLFKRKGEDNGKVRVIKRKQTPSSPLLGDKERSSSMSKLLDAVESGDKSDGVLGDLSRARSFRAEPAPGQKVFRAADLLQGELLGTGFFGQVYKVTHKDTNEVMVLKQLYRVDEEAQRNFLKEVAVLRSLRHRNVLRFAGVLYRDRRLHLLAEYVAGPTLHALLQDVRRVLPWEVRARLARDVSAGVGYLHRMNVIHRDLNSHNCLVREAEMSVVVADFGLARVVQRTASSSHHHSHTLRRKRYTVVGNPYWMAPEMMNGNVYDEKVDVFSFGIILCEIIGRVSADPDYLPRRSDFGLNEAAFQEKFCRNCPEHFFRIAFVACQLDPDARPSFEVMQIWLESLVMYLSHPGSSPPALLAGILQYSRGNTVHPATPECCQHSHGSGTPCGPSKCQCQCSEMCLKRSPSKASVDWSKDGIVKSASGVRLSCGWGQALGKCVSASQLSARPRPLSSRHARSHTALAPGYILRADGPRINITKVDDISEWLDPVPLKRTSPDGNLNNLVNDTKSRKVETEQTHLPAFLRNQSVEGLETSSKHDANVVVPFCRHQSITDQCEIDEDKDSDSSDDEELRQDMTDTKNNFTNIVMKGNLLSKKASYDVTDVILRHTEDERKENCLQDKRFNTDYSTKSAVAAKEIENIPKILDSAKPIEKPKFFAKNLLSPKLTRLFKPNTAEVVRKNAEDKEEKSKSKFFIQRPTSPSIRSTYRIRPLSDEKNISSDVLKSDLKLANLGKPMTPIFRRHNPNEKSFAGGRFSYRDRGYEPKIQNDLNINPKGAVEKKISQLNRNTQTVSLNAVLEKNPLANDEKTKKREYGITRSNYVRLANLRIKDLDQTVKEKPRNENKPIEA